MKLVHDYTALLTHDSVSVPAAKHLAGAKSDSEPTPGAPREIILRPLPAIRDK